jgi:hypothetical protein
VAQAFITIRICYVLSAQEVAAVFKYKEKKVFTVGVITVTVSVVVRRMMENIIDA